MRLKCNEQVKYAFQIELQDFVSEQVPTRNYQKYFAVEVEHLKKLSWELVFTLGVHESTDKFGEVETQGMMLKDFQGLVLPPPAYFSYEPLPVSWEKILSRADVVNPLEHTAEMDEFGKQPVYRRENQTESSNVRLQLRSSAQNSQQQSGYERSHEPRGRSRSRHSRKSDYGSGLDEEDRVPEDEEMQGQADYESSHHSSLKPRPSRGHLSDHKLAQNPSLRGQTSQDDPSHKYETAGDKRTDAGDDTHYRGSLENAQNSGAEDDSLMAELDEYDWKLHKGVSKVIGEQNK